MSDVVKRGSIERFVDGPGFQRWTREMIGAGLARSVSDCGRQLGMTADWAIRAQEKGVDRRTALAMRALLHRMEPWK